MRLLTDRRFLYSLFSGAAFLFISFVIQSYAVMFATETASNSVTDVVLSNTPVFNVDGFFVWGAVLLGAVVTLTCVVRLRRAPFILKSLALFTVIRSFFVALTHINPYPQQIAITPSIATRLFPSLFTGKDLFFSGHTGLPFLMALIFWDNVFLRTVFLAFSIMFAIVVLLGHLHYSIDVASAYFITFTIFTMAKAFFKRDWER
ncbi:MAG: hypothetical protein KGI78_02390 [Patescibacteria group bacterium]|nr:hypothetical protein [Patescibacteria group bacterium]MDE1945146.1 hypothetical protein [Patescibacteria group bacterium]MDE2057681.1 hypothetical protein [Patescibacteria group bacterium]